MTAWESEIYSTAESDDIIIVYLGNDDFLVLHFIGINRLNDLNLYAWKS